VLKMPAQYNPADEREVARILADASAANTPIEVVGAGTKASVGRPVQAAATLATRSLHGIALYEPTEMVMAAGSGTPLASVEAELRAQRQMLAFEPVELGAIGGTAPYQATIGGVFASNLSGARRISAGAARDHLLGIKAVTGAGEFFKSGGRVMKNVAGYDLCRALSGSWGTLAVMTEVTFKVVPAPDEIATLVLFGLPDEIAVEVLCSAMGTPFEVSGAAHLQASLTRRLRHEDLSAQGEAITALRLENFAKSVAYRAGRLKQLLKVYGAIHHLDGTNSRAFWAELRELSTLQRSQAPLWRISTAPRQGPKVYSAIARYMDARAYYDWSGGLIWVEVLSTADAGAADIRRVVAAHGGHATLIRAAASVRSAVDVFQPLDPGLEKLSKKLKAAFDPSGILNKGRMYADL
jgi:glycolate oxidase FAD binding subunit